MPSPKLALSVLLLAGAIASGATAAGGADPGIASKTILVGGTAPLSGTVPADAALARGASAYLAYANARGGVHGRRVAYTVLDDADDPVQTLLATQQLVEQDRVFAIFNSAGTEHNEAIRPYLNRARVPQLFVGSGATTFGRDFERYPWTIGFQPSHRAEGWVYGTYLARARNGAKVGVLFQDDAFGKELVAGLRQGIARSQVKVAAAVPYDVTAVDVQAEIAQLKSSGADVLALFATPPFAIDAYAAASGLGWRPLIVNSARSSGSSTMTLASEGGTNRSVEGSISIAFAKEPTDASWRSDPAMRLYRSIMARHAKGADAMEVGHVHGMAAAYELVGLLEAAGKNPTRAGVIARTRQLNDASNPFLLPGIVIRTSASDRFPVEQALLQRWSKGSWRSFGGLWSYPAG